VIKTVLFATDFTSITDRAKSYALQIAKSMGAKVTLIHAIEDIDDATEEVQGFLKARMDGARAKAEVVAKDFVAEGVECDVKVELGKRWKVVVDAAGSYDLVVLGSHKIHDGDKVYLGTTTHKVFFAADVPLLVVPPT